MAAALEFMGEVQS